MKDERAKPVRWRLMVLVAAVAGMAATLPADAVPKPARSGSITSGTGWFVEYPLGGCQTSPECAAWLRLGCNPALVGRDPALTASIVDVAALAGGKARRFQFGASKQGGLAWGGVVVQLWRASCTEARDKQWRSTDCDGNATGRDCTAVSLRIPAGVRWMTVTGYQDNLNIAWTLT